MNLYSPVTLVYRRSVVHKDKDAVLVTPLDLVSYILSALVTETVSFHVFQAFVC